MASQVSGWIGQINPGDGTNYAIGSTAYGECTTVSASSTKYVDMTGFVLKTGATIHVKFSEANTASDPQLNVNGTGAKPIYLSRYTSTTAKSPVGDDSWEGGSVVSFTYTGSYWMINDPITLCNYLRAGNNSSTSNNVTINGQTYLKQVQGDHVRSAVRLYPGKGMNITSDANGNVTFASTFSGVAISDTEPTDDGDLVWINPDDSDAVSILTQNETNAQYVSYDHAQTLTSAQQNRALQNIGISDGTDTQKTNLATFAGISLTVVDTI